MTTTPGGRRKKSLTKAEIDALARVLEIPPNGRLIREGVVPVVLNIIEGRTLIGRVRNKLNTRRRDLA